VTRQSVYLIFRNVKFILQQKGEWQNQMDGQMDGLCWTDFYSIEKDGTSLAPSRERDGKEP